MDDLPQQQDPAKPYTFRSELAARLGLGEMWFTIYPPGHPDRPVLRAPDPNWKNPLAILDEPRPKRVRPSRSRSAATKLNP